MWSQRIPDRIDFQPVNAEADCATGAIQPLKGRILRPKAELDTRGQTPVLDPSCEIS
ncbi:MAG: hypothetical protein LAO21_14290 [Acidobacteriia bacterium]|nr:hypothetical protein [Terriglobia bacterium]